MNKNLYRIIFNQKRGQLMVVGETASAQGKAAGGETSPGIRASMQATLLPLKFAMSVALGMVLWQQPMAYAQIIADPNAPSNQRATVLQTANGLPQVNIQTPSAAGVSRNTYSQFDVQRNGAILNNSRNNVQTQLGGWVQGNPWLATGPARVILNEVNSSNPSQLKGYVEVGGQRAEVIIANPAGIHVDGAGFINASGVTLTTGTPVINSGSLDAFRVQGGAISINGAGLDTGNADYTGILARAVQVNAGIWAKDLKVVTGTNQVDAGTLAGTPAASPIAGTGAAPAFALDVAQLGGMYAGKIFLIGTEAGLGVRNSGVIGATAGDVVLQSNGWLSNSGGIQASGNNQINTAGRIDNSGTIYANGNTALSGQGGISNSGLTGAQGNTTLQATGAGSQISSTKDSVIAAGLNPEGSLQSSGDLSAMASDVVALNGRAIAGGNAILGAGRVDLSGSQVSAQDVSVTASTGAIDASRASVNAQGSLNASAAQTLRTDGAAVSAKQLRLAAHNLSNVGGEIIQTGAGDTGLALAGDLNNSQGRIATNAQNLTLSAQTLSNTDGKIEHAGGGTLGITATALNDQRGQIISNGALDVNAGSVNHESANTIARQVTIGATAFSNRGGEIVQTGTGITSITSTGALDNTAGSIASNGDTRISAQSLNNQGGVVQATGAANLNVFTSAALDNSAGGSMAAGGNVTLGAASLNNSQGQISAGGALSTSASGATTNTRGLMAANGDASLTSASLDNSQGTIASVQEKVNVTTGGSTVNDSGRIQAGGGVALRNAGLSNTQAAGASQAGSITSSDITIETNGQVLNNAGGTIAAAQAATLQTGALNNDAGLIQAGAALSLDTQGQALRNTNAASHASGAGGITAQGSLALNSGDLTNYAGFIGAKGAISASSAKVSNSAGGQIVGESGIDFASTGFDNRGGQVQALGDVRLDAAAGTIDNTAGLVRSAGNTTLGAGSVINSNSVGTNQGIEGNYVAIAANTIANDSGTIRADSNATLTSSGTVNNAGGLISAGSAATLQDSAAAKTLTITNGTGTIIGGKNTIVNAASLSNDGKLLSKGDLSLALSTEFINGGEVTANGSATISTPGSITNSGKLQAGNTLAVTAGTIGNAATGDINAGTTKVTAADTLTNRGVIDGITTEVNAGTLNNLGTGRMYGDQLSIAVGTLNNTLESGTAATIAARNRLDIGAQTINNAEHALIFSGGDMAIGGKLDANRHATGQADAVNNASATVEALGNLVISTAQLNNTDNHFSYSMQPTSVEYGVTETVSPTLYRVFTRTTTSPVANPGDPGNILAGGDITLHSPNINNHLSHIVAGGVLASPDSSLAGLGADGHRLLNTGVDAQKLVRDSGTTHALVHVPESGICFKLFTIDCEREHDEWRTAPYDITSQSTVTVSQMTPAQGSGQQTPDAAKPHTTTDTSAAGLAVATVSPAVASGAAINAPGVPVSVTGSAPVVRAGAPNTLLPNTSLFHVNTAPASSFLVETDPRFANYKTWLGSDYLLSALDIDPATLQKRLGDGFYEQRLVREQVTKLTGQRFVGDYNTDEAQFRALMDNGVTYAKGHKLRPGIALSAAQMAQLTSDIVWLVEREVTLPDGSKTQALVPQVYVRVQPGDLDGSGALLAGREVNINTRGDLTNSGTIAGRTVVNLSAENVQNLGGRISGDAVNVAARNDLDNIGGQISAKSSLAVNAGRDLNLVSTTSSATNQIGSNTFSRTGLDRVAGLYVSKPGGTLLASAGRDANIVGGVIQSQGSAQVTAGNNLNLKTVTTGNANSVVWDANNRVNDSQSVELGSQVQAAGNLTLIAGQDLNARAASVQAGQALQLSAGHDVNLTAGAATQSVDEAHRVKRQGFLTSNTATSHSTRDDSTAQVSKLSGDSVTVLAGNNALLEGTQITAQKDALVYAGNQLIVSAARDSRNQSASSETLSRGLHLSLGADGVQFGTRGGGSGTGSATNTARGAQVSSAQGNASLYGASLAAVEGASVSATQGTASITGGSVIVQGAVNTSSSTTSTTERGAKVNAFGWSKPAEGFNHKGQSSTGTEQTSLARTTLSGQNASIVATDGDARIAGTGVTTPGTLTLGAGGTLYLDGQQTEKVSSTQSQSRDLAYQKMKDSGSQAQRTEYNQFHAATLQVSAPRISAQIGSKDSALQLARQPGMQWVGQLTNDPALEGKVNWTQLQDASRDWNYKQQGLTPEGAAIVTIVVAFFTYGAASSAGGALAASAGFTGASATVVAGATTAAITTLAAQAAVATLNHPDDPGAALKELGSSANTRALVTAMLTGGVLGSLNLTPTGSPTVGGGAQPFMNQLGQNLQAGVARSLISTAINGGSLEDSLKNAITSAFIDTGTAQGAFAIGSNLQPGSVANVMAHAIAGCAAGAARASASGGCAPGALGAAVGELAAGAYDPSASNSQGDTVQFAAMMSAIGAAVAGGDASQINLASQAGGNAAANNWLATRQKAQMEKELKAANSALDKARVMGTWTYTSAKQDALTASGIGKGLADSGWSDVKGITEFLLNPLAGLNGLKQIIASEDIRQQLGDAAFKQLDAKIERMKTALDVGGDQNAEQLGRDLGGLVWQVGSVVTGAAGLAKGGVALAQTGIRVGEDVLEGMAVSKAYKLADAEAIASAKQYNNFYADGASKLYPMGLKTTSGVVIKANPDKTTTVLGSYGKDTGRIINDELGLPKSMLIEGSIQPGSFNLLNTPDSLFKTLGPERFWEQVNKPWLDAAIQRNDVVALATKPDFRPFSSDPGKSGNLFKADGGLTGFGREIDYLSKKGYVYEPSLGKMVKP